MVYYVNNEVHREDGPASVWDDGSKYWYCNGVAHREDGPAVEYGHDYSNFFVKYRYYINGEEIDPKEFRYRKRISKLKNKKLLAFNKK